MADGILGHDGGRDERHAGNDKGNAGDAVSYHGWKLLVIWGGAE
jgi:hypothetical protein